MPNRSAPFRIWTYCRAATLRRKLAEAGCEIVAEPASDEPQPREVTSNGLEVMVLPAYTVRAARRDGETEEAARARIHDIVNACEAAQDAREQVEAERHADTPLTNVLKHTIKVLWVLERPNAAAGAAARTASDAGAAAGVETAANAGANEIVTLELRRPSPREKRLFPDAHGTAIPYEAAEVAESGNAHVKYRVTMRMR